MVTLSTGGVPTQFPAVTIVNADGSSFQDSLSTQVTSQTSARGAATTRWTSGHYYYSVGARSTVAQGTGVMTAIPYWPPLNASVDRLACEITTGVATAVIRLGIYTDNGFGVPANLVVDSVSTIDASTNGVKELTIASTPLPDPLYWFCAVSQVASATLRMILNGLTPVGSSSLGGAGGGSANTGFSQTGVTGALPATFTGTNRISAPYLVIVRAV